MVPTDCFSPSKICLASACSAINSSLVEVPSAEAFCGGVGNTFGFALPAAVGFLREFVRGFFRALELLETRDLFGRAGAAAPGDLSVADVDAEAFATERAGRPLGRGLPPGRFNLDGGFLEVATRAGLVPGLVGLAVGRRPGRLGRFMVLGLLGLVGLKIDLEVGFSAATTGPNSSLVNSPLPS